MTFKITYDQDANTGYLYLGTGQELVDYTIEVNPSVRVDVGDNGRLIGVETIGRPLDVLALAEALLMLGRPDGHPAKESPKPCTEGFHWIGQSFTHCDRCGIPAWEHEGIAVPNRAMRSPLDPVEFVLRPWKPGEREACRRKWEGS